MNANLQKPEFLEKCIIRATVQKQHRGNKTTYVRSECKKPIEAFYIGIRKASEGHSEQIGTYVEDGIIYSEGTAFYPSRTFTVFQFIINEHRNIILALPEDVERAVAS